MQKVAIPTDGGNQLTHFGRTEIMSVFTVDNGQVVGREDRVNHSDHDDPAHHKNMLNLVKDVQLVLVNRMGPPMVQTLNHFGIRALMTPFGEVDKTLQAYLQSQQGGPALPELTLEAAEASHGGHGHHHDHDHHHH